MHPEIVRCVGFSPNGSRLVTTDNFDAGTYKILNVATGKPMLEFRCHAAKSMVAMFTPDGQRVITGSDDGSLRFWDVSTGVLLGSLEVGERTRSLAMLPDGDAFVSASREGWVRLWRTLPD